MNQTNRRTSQRHISDLNVELVLRDQSSSELILEPNPGVLHDFSRHGARLVLNRIRFESCHFFYTPNEKENYQLYLEFLDDGGERLSIPVQAVWYRGSDDEQISYFQMGVKFQIEPNDPIVLKLGSAATGKKIRPQNWLSIFINKFCKQ